MPKSSAVLDAIVAKLAESLAGSTRSLFDELVEVAEPLAGLPGGPAIEELIEQVGEPMSAQLEMFADTVGVRWYHARAFVFEREQVKDKSVWAAHPPRYADPRAFTLDPDDLLEELRLWQQAQAGDNESIVLWLHGVNAMHGPLFIAVARHSCGTSAQFLLRGRTWARAPLGKRSLEVLLHTSSRRGADNAEFWSEAIAKLISALAANRSPAFDEQMTKLGVTAPISDKALAGLLQRLLASREGLRAVQSLSRVLAHETLAESQRLLETLAGLVEQAQETIEEQAQKIRKEQAGALKRLQSSLERERTLAQGIKRRADDLTKENSQLRQRSANVSAMRSGDLWQQAKVLFEGV